MGTELTVALIAAAVSVASASIAIIGQLRLARLQAETSERREELAKKEAARRVVARFREPLCRAAFDLQSRIYNLVCLDVLDRFHVNGGPREREYVVDSTVYVFAEYLGWTEIIRREVQFLDLGAVEDSRHLAQLQHEISESLLRSDLPSPFRIFRGEQRAIGELMIDTSSQPPHCLGPAAFALRTAPAFCRWFDLLRADVDWLAAERDRRIERLVFVQHALVDLIEFLDADGRRFPRTACRKIPTPAPAAATAGASLGTEATPGFPSGAL